MLKAIPRATAMVIVSSIILLTSPTIFKHPTTLEAYEPVASNFGSQKEGIYSIKAKIEAKKDNRVQRLERFLKSQQLPMTGESKNLVAIADKYNLDWRLLPAIAGVESTFGQFVPAGSYNAYGWHNGKFYFRSWEDASTSVAKGINEKWGYMGKITHWKIGPFYAENPRWASRVERYMKLISYH
ncbi:MAG: hypothetical protein WD187_01360 [Candidatus Woykebacteria bacterium]